MLRAATAGEVLLQLGASIIIALAEDTTCLLIDQKMRFFMYWLTGKPVKVKFLKIMNPTGANWHVLAITSNLLELN